MWKQGVVVCMVLYTVLLYKTTPIPPVMNTQRLPASPRAIAERRNYNIYIYIYIYVCIYTYIYIHILYIYK